MWVSMWSGETAGTDSWTGESPPAISRRKGLRRTREGSDAALSRFGIPDPHQFVFSSTPGEKQEK